ncbi:MAG: hypothetical protein QNJ09_09430 [Paracoccaceae bacterium]|nr:hypothetical protein [Paracoccaceae bacterium]
MIVSLLIPTLILMATAAIVTRLVEAVLPESMAAMALCLGLSAALVWLLAAIGFAALYALELPQAISLLGDRPEAGLRHFLILGAKAGLIWGPIVLLVVATSPQRWKTATW